MTVMLLSIIRDRNSVRTTRWSRFTVMLIGRLSGRKSLRDITDNLKAQSRRLYHLGMKDTSRATSAGVNRDQPAPLYETIFYSLLEQCRAGS